MYAKKAIKSEKESKALCNIFFPHNIAYPEDHLTNLFKYQKTVVCSIDPGIKNYAIRIVVRNNCSKKSKSLYYNRWELDQPPKGSQSEVEVDVTYHSLDVKFTSIIDLIEQVDVLIIERQLPINYNSTRIMQYTMTWFEHVFKQNKTGHHPIICTIAPHLKGKMLGAPRGLPKPELKKWSVAVADDILMENEDEWSLNKLRKEKKKDDLADVVTQYEAFILYFSINQLDVQPLIKRATNKHIKIKIKDVGTESTKTSTSAN